MQRPMKVACVPDRLLIALALFGPGLVACGDDASGAVAAVLVDPPRCPGDRWLGQSYRDEATVRVTVGDHADTFILGRPPGRVRADWIGKRARVEVSVCGDVRTPPPEGRLPCGLAGVLETTIGGSADRAAVIELPKFELRCDDGSVAFYPADRPAATQEDRR
jgi:hypothetical protein